MKKIFTEYAQKNDYDDEAYRRYFDSIENNTAAWDEFLPAPIETNHESIILRVKCEGDADFKNYRQENNRLYMLKNELNLGGFYGFTCTDLFNILKAISVEKPKWFGRALGFDVSTDYISGAYSRVVSLEAKDMSTLREIVIEISNLAAQVAKTNQMMIRWVAAANSKRNKQSVLRRCGDYLTHVARLEKVNLYSDQAVKGEGKTRYHYFHLISSSQNYDELMNKTIVFNIDMESMLYGFEEFYFTFNYADMDMKNISLSAVVPRSLYMY